MSFSDLQTNTGKQNLVSAIFEGCCPKTFLLLKKLLSKSSLREYFAFFESLACLVYVAVCLVPVNVSKTPVVVSLRKLFFSNKKPICNNWLLASLGMDCASSWCCHFCWLLLSCLLCTSLCSIESRLDQDSLYEGLVSRKPRDVYDKRWINKWSTSRFPSIIFCRNCLFFLNSLYYVVDSQYKNCVCWLRQLSVDSNR